jgi:molybdenum cofactor cytidylyltransferase
MTARGGGPGEDRIGIAVLAAGASRRLGFPKQLVPFRGQPLLRTIVLTARRSAVTRVAVVLGARVAQIAPCLSDLDVDVIDNRAWDEGLATSIGRATAWALERGYSALVLVSGDQPHLEGGHLERLLAAHRPQRRPVASSYSGICGIPAIFPSRLFPALQDLWGDRGAGGILRTARDTTSVDWPQGAFDLDDIDDLARLRAAEKDDPATVEKSG